MGSTLSIDDVDAIDALAKAIAREVVQQLTQLANPSIAVQPKGTVFEVGPIRIDIDRHEASIDGRVLDFRPREFAVLAALARNAGHVLTRDSLLEAAWPEDAAFRMESNRTVDVHIRRIRCVLGSQRHRVETVTGLGYKLRDR